MKIVAYQKTAFYNEMYQCINLLKEKLKTIKKTLGNPLSLIVFKKDYKYLYLLFSRYDNGEIKVWDLRQMKLIWETSVGIKLKKQIFKSILKWNL